MEYVIEAENLWWRYEGSEKWAIKNINLRIKPGEFVVITGSNENGKSTLVSCFNGLIPHAYRGEMKGSVRVFGYDTKETPISSLCAFVGMAFQDPETQFLLSRVEDEVAFGPQNLGFSAEKTREKVLSALQTTHLLEFRTKDPVELSGGQKQRTALAATIAMSPKIIVLDEPTSMLDPIGKDEFMEALSFMRKQKIVETIIVVEHHLDELIEMADRFILMKDGEIILDSPKEEFFTDVEFLINNGIRVPDICRVSAYLKSQNITERVTFTLEEAKKILRSAFQSGRLKVIKKPKPDFSIQDKLRKSTETVIEVKDLHFVYPDGTVALRGVNLNINSGEFVALIGQNGSGKTTLAKLIAGIYKPTSGYVKVFGLDTKTMTTDKLVTKVGYVFQNPDHQIFNETIRKELMFGINNLKRLKLIKDDEIEPRIKESLKITGIPENLLDEHPFLLSKGMRQRVAIASILVMRPQILVVDEPTTGQDTQQSIEVMNFLKQLNDLGYTIIIITHEMWVVAKYADRTIAMAQGKILLDGPTKIVLSNTEILKKTFVSPPQITLLSQHCSDYGLPSDILTVDEFLEAIEITKQEGNF